MELSIYYYEEVKLEIKRELQTFEIFFYRNIFLYGLTQFEVKVFALSNYKFLESVDPIISLQ